MKAHTDLEQSKKLAEILPLESADMSWYKATEMFPFELHTLPYSKHFISNDGDKLLPCWTVAAIIELLPYDIKGHSLAIYKSYCPNEKNFAYELYYEADFYYDYEPSILVSTSSIELINACYEMIMKLHELKLL